MNIRKLFLTSLLLAPMLLSVSYRVHADVKEQIMWAAAGAFMGFITQNNTLPKIQKLVNAMSFGIFASTLLPVVATSCCVDGVCANAVYNGVTFATPNTAVVNATTYALSYAASNLLTRALNKK